MGEQFSDSTIFVGNVDKAIQEIDLFTLFENFGRILDIKLKVNYYTKESRGFAFIVYQRRRSALEAKKKMNFYKLLGKELVVQLTDKLEKKKDELNFMLKNLPPELTGKQLTKICENFGEVITCQVNYRIDKNFKVISTGTGYVQFQEVDVEKFIEEMKQYKSGEEGILAERF